jgi:hypothetical protein
VGDGKLFFEQSVLVAEALVVVEGGAQAVARRRRWRAESSPVLARAGRRATVRVWVRSCSISVRSSGWL